MNFLNTKRAEGGARVDCLELDEILARHSDCNESFERQMVHIVHIMH
jgi:hypothetical protein